MLRCLSLSLAIWAAFAASLGAATPVRYDVEAVVATVAKDGREPFGSKFYFAADNQVIYRVLPQNRSDTDPAPNWSYWSPANQATVLPVTGYESVDVTALNSDGKVVGRSVTENSPTPNPHREAALFWTAAAGSTIPTGFDPGSSGLTAINAAGLAVGFTNNGTYRTVLWDAANPSAGVTEIIPPAGYGNCDVRGVSATGETLLYVSNPGLQNVAIWNGTSSSVVGPAPNSGETFYPTNCAINARGDVAMLFFTTGGNYRLIYVPAANRAAYQIFTFSGPVTSGYRLQISDAGLASCETSNGIVSIVSSSRAQQLTFAGYSAFLNASGELVFGQGGALYYWDAAAWTGAPAAVSLAIPAASTAPTIVGFNDSGRLLALADNSAQTTRTLSILAPAYPEPAMVTLTAIRKPLRLTVAKSVRQRLTRTHLSGGTPGDIRYILRGKPPSGLRFRASDGFFVGQPSRTQRKTVRVAATYLSAGVKTQSAFVPITVVVR